MHVTILLRISVLLVQSLAIMDIVFKMIMILDPESNWDEDINNYVVPTNGWSHAGATKKERLIQSNNFI